MRNIGLKKLDKSGVYLIIKILKLKLNKVMKPTPKEEDKQKQFIDPRQIHFNYRLSHAELQSTLKRLK